MSKLTNLVENPDLLTAYELNLIAQLKTISNIRLSQQRLVTIPTSTYFQHLGSVGEMNQDIESEQMILNGLKTSLINLIERSVQICQ
jgi:hypothetical protein